MKRIFIAILLSLVLTSPSFAHELPSISPTPQAAVPTPVGYALPYPGLLPGSPLYPLKALRDKIVETLITDVVRKADFYLLQADKRLNAGVLLSQQGKFNEAHKTVSKGENYMDMAIGRARAAKSQNENVDEIVNKLHLAIMKHEEVLKDLSKRASGDAKKGFENDLKRVEKMQDEVNELKSK